MSLISSDLGEMESEPRSAMCWRRHLNTEKQINVLVGGYHFLLCSGIIVGWLLYNPRLAAEEWLAEGTELEVFIIYCAWFSCIIVGGLHAGYYIDDIGRRNTFLLSGVMYIVSAAVMVLFKNAIVSIVIGLMCAGYAHGSVYVTLLAYVGEISSKENRGLIMTTLYFAYTLGIFVYKIMVTFATNFDDHDSTLVLRLMIILIVVVGMLFSYIYMTESPVYLLMKEDITGANHVFSKLRTNDDENLKTNVEFRNLQKFVDDDLKTDLPTVFRSKALHLFFMLKLLAIVLFNLPLNLSRIMGVTMDVGDMEMSSFFIVLARVCGAMFGILFVENMSRRRLYRTSMAMTGIVLIVMVVFELINKSLIIPNMCYEFVTSAGLIQLIDIFATEAFSSSKRGKGLSLIVFYEHLIQLLLCALTYAINKPSEIGEGDIKQLFKRGTLILTLILVILLNFLKVPETKNIPLTMVRKEVEIGITFSTLRKK